MFYEATILICALSTPRQDCNRITATDIITTIPESPDGALCGLGAQIEAAKSGRVDMRINYAKVLCTPGGRQIVPPVPNNAG